MNFDWNEETESLIKKALELGLIVSCEDQGYLFDCTFINASKHWDVEFYTNDSPKQIFFDTFSDASLSYFLHGLIIGHYYGRDTQEVEVVSNPNIVLKQQLEAKTLLIEQIKTEREELLKRYESTLEMQDSNSKKVMDTIIDTRNENIQLKSRLDELRNAHQLLVEKLTGGDRQ